MRRVVSGMSLIVTSSVAACESPPTAPEAFSAPTALLSVAGGDDDGEVRCVGFLTGAFDNVTVPRGQSCTLFIAKIRGNLRVLPGARLTSLGTDVGGNFRAEGAAFLDMQQDEIGGNVEIFEGAGEFNLRSVAALNGNVHVAKSFGSFTLNGVTAGHGNIKLEDNLVTSLFMRANRAGQNIQLLKNRGPGPKTVFGNVAGEAIQCWENDPPFEAFRNVAPKLEGQCDVPFVE